VSCFAGVPLRYGSSEKFCNIKLGYQLSAISYQPLKAALFAGFRADS
jgi:hypothetical protein